MADRRVLGIRRSMTRLPHEVSPTLGSMTLQLRSDPRFLAVVRAMVRSYCRLAGFGEQRTEQVTLAVDESCANVIRHCYGGQHDQALEVGLEIVESTEGIGLVVQVRDHGPKAPEGCFEPPEHKDLECPGGLGLRLIHSIMDSVEVDRSVTEGNLLVLGVGPEQASTGQEQGEDGP